MKACGSCGYKDCVCDLPLVWTGPAGLPPRLVRDVCTPPEAASSCGNCERLAAEARAADAFCRELLTINARQAVDIDRLRRLCDQAGYIDPAARPEVSSSDSRV